MIGLIWIHIWLLILVYVPRYILIILIISLGNNYWCYNCWLCVCLSLNNRLMNYRLGLEYDYVRDYLFWHLW